jgi:hypothetical protein
MRAATHGIPSETTIELERFIDLEFLPALAAIPSETEEPQIVVSPRQPMVWQGVSNIAKSPWTEAEDERPTADAIPSETGGEVTIDDRLRWSAASMEEYIESLQAQLASLRERVVEECIARATGLLSQPDDAFHDPCHAWDSALACLITDLRALVKSPPVSGEKDG